MRGLLTGALLLAIAALAACGAEMDPLSGGGPIAPPRVNAPIDAGVVLAMDAAARAPDAEATRPDAARHDAGTVESKDAEVPEEKDASPAAQPDAIAADAAPASDAARPADGGVAPDAAAPDAAPPPIAQIDGLRVYLNLGDSVAEGSNASAGRGYARLLWENHSAYPAYATHNLEALYANARFVNHGDSGAKSDDVANQARALPDDNGGDAIITIYVGGNDFNDDIRTMISEAATTAAITTWQQNMTTVMTRLTAKYVNAAEGRGMIVVIANIHDPTGGTGTVPATFNDGFCNTLRNPLLTPTVRTLALANLARFNDAIRAFAQQHGALLLDSHALFLAHGVNAPTPDRWIDTDCTHPTNEGHHQLRRELWRLLTGQLY